MAKKSAPDLISRQIYSEIFPPSPSKSDKRRKEIIEGAIQAYAAIDYNHISYDDIAKPAKTSRRLVQHYFPDKNELFSVAMKLVRAQYQSLVVEALEKATTPEERFRAYVKAAVAWPEHFSLHVRSWFLYYVVCAQQPRLRKLHEDLAKMGEERIIALLTEMRPKARTSAAQRRFLAKTLQRLITGALIEICSESSAPEIERVKEEVLQASLMTVQATMGA